MSEWRRTTRELRVDGLPPDMRAVIDKHIELYNLGPILSDAVMCILTESDKPKKGSFGKARTLQHGVVVTPRWIVWAVAGTKTQTSAMSAQLRDVVVTDYALSPAAQLVPDTGIEISGRFTDVSRNALVFIGLEDGPVGHTFKHTVIRAAQDAKA